MYGEEIIHGQRRRGWVGFSLEARSSAWGNNYRGIRGGITLKRERKILKIGGI